MPVPLKYRHQFYEQQYVQGGYHIYGIKELQGPSYKSLNLECEKADIHLYRRLGDIYHAVGDVLRVSYVI